MIEIYYDDIKPECGDKWHDHRQENVPSFCQGYKNTTYLIGDITFEGLAVSLDIVALLINNPTNVPLYAKVDSKVQIKVESLK